MRFVPLAVALIAVAVAIGAGALALDTRSDADAAEAELAALQAELDELAALSQRVTRAVADGEKTAAELKALRECLPEIDGNVVAITSYLRYPDGGLVTSNYSRVCTNMLYGGAGD